MKMSKRIILRSLGFVLALLLLMSSFTLGWTAFAEGETYRLTIDPNGGRWSNGTTSVRVVQNASGVAIALPTDLSRSGFLFGGWQLSGGGRVINGSTCTYVFGTEDGTVVASWGAVMTTLYVDPNGGHWQGNVTSPRQYTQAGGTTFTPTETPTRNGYNFIGWQLSGIGGTWDGNTFTFGDYDCSLHAMWDPIVVTSTLTIVPSGGKWQDNSTDTKTVTQNSGTQYQLTETPTRSGYTFKGWTHSGGGSLSGNVFSFGDTDGTVTAQWAIVYKLTLNLNGGYTESEREGYTYPNLYKDYTNINCNLEVGESIYIGSIRGGIYKNGYSFDRWTPRSNWVGSIRAADGTNMAENYWYTAGRGDEMLFAQWNPITYTVTFDANGGDPVSAMGYTIESTDVLPSATRSGYQFLGWKPVPDSQNNYYFWAAVYQGVPFCWDAETVYPAGTSLTGKYMDLTMAAQWEPCADQISVTIGDQIGVNLLLNLDARNAETVTVTYKDLNGDEQTETFTDFSSLPKTDEGLYKIAVQIAPAQIADSVTVYIDGETLDACVKDYCNTLVAGDYTPEVVALAQAVLDYGQAANNFFNYTDETISAVTNLSADDAKAWTPVLSDTTGKVRSISFMALTKPEFRFYMKDMTEAEAAALNKKITVSGVSGVAARFVKNVQGNILLEVTGLKAEDVDETITVTIDGLGTITFAGNDFAYLMANNAATEALGAALYAYGAAAKACFG